MIPTFLFTGHQSLLDKLPQRTVSNTSSVNSSPRLFNLQLSFDSSGNSLPSSQEEESVRKLQEKLSQDKELLELSGTSSTLSSGGSTAFELSISTHNKYVLILSNSFSRLQKHEIDITVKDRFSGKIGHRTFVR